MRFISAIFLLLCLTPAVSLAQDATTLPLRGAFSTNPLDGLDPKATIPNKQMDVIYKECRSTYPE